jgi:hypothetical protein
VIAAVAVTETLTEVRADRAIEALRAMTAPVARLRRDGRAAEVPAASLVPGYVVAVGRARLVPGEEAERLCSRPGQVHGVRGEGREAAAEDQLDRTGGQASVAAHGHRSELPRRRPAPTR